MENKKFNGAYWIVGRDEHEICATEFTCSNCRTEFAPSDMTDEEWLYYHRYCPWCGFEMQEAPDIFKFADFFKQWEDTKK